MELDNEMASLAINEKKRRLSSESADLITLPADENSAESNPPQVALRRSGRKRVCPADNLEKRRVTIKPKKYDFTNFQDVESYYLDKRVKRLPSTLETIYEEPKIEVMSVRKYRRCVNFTSLESVDKMKTKKRSMKAKKLCNNKKPHWQKISMDFLKKQLEKMEDSS